jgi:hypothetical protein
VLVMLSIILTASVMYPDITGATILEVLAGGTLLAVVAAIAMLLLRKRGVNAWADALSTSLQQKAPRDTWRMPPLTDLPPPNLTLSKRVWMGVLRGYLIVAVALVVVKVVQVAWQ